MDPKIKILILDDEKHFTEELFEFLQNAGFEVYETNTVVDAQLVLHEHEIDLLILDVRLPGVNGLDLMEGIKKQNPNIEIIVISAHGDMDTVIKAMRNGACDYLRKPFRQIDIQISIERTQRFLFIQRRLKNMEEKNSLISSTLEKKIDRHFIGVSPQILKVYDAALTASRYPDANVLITGESGTGKENVARIIHYSSKRKDHLFCAVNSSAIADTLIDSEFFGYKKGSFTGATTDKMGFFEVSHEGTLFLDEIADMPLNLQSKILRATEERVITRVGDTKPIPTDFRIISATNHDIEKLVDQREFRLDLFHRLNTLHIHIPPLRERPEDIGPLLNHFLNYYIVKFNKPKLQVSDEVYDALNNYEFPGNVRELKNMTERAIILCKSNLISIHDFPVKPVTKKVVDSKKQLENLVNQEASLIRKTLKECNYNQKAAAKLLGISRDALIRKMTKYDIKISRTET